MWHFIPGPKYLVASGWSRGAFYCYEVFEVAIGIGIILILNMREWWQRAALLNSVFLLFYRLR